MIPHLLEMGIAISLALGFAAVGEGVLRKRSRGALGWTQSFLVGAGVLAATLFPLSLLLPHGALRATLAVMALGVVRMAWFRVFGKADEAVGNVDSKRVGAGMGRWEFSNELHRYVELTHA